MSSSSESKTVMKRIHLRVRHILLMLCVIYTVASLLTISYVLIFRGSVAIQLAKYLMIEDDYDKADAIILLGGEEGSARMLEAVNLYNEGFGGVIINSGNGDYDSANKRFTNFGLSSDDWINEPNSTTTYENALYSLDIVLEKGYKSVIIVSTPQQSKRARWIFQRVYKDAGITLYSAVADESQFVPENINEVKFIKEQFTVQFVKLIYYYIEYWHL